MKHFVIYETNGRVTRHGYCLDETFELQAGEGELILEAEYTGNQYVEDGALVAMPPQPSLDHVFNYSTKAWELDVALVTSNAYAIRNQLLREGPDRISPIWWASMTPTEQQAWLDYRQALLDVSNQPGFPTSITWPTKPE